MSCQYVIWYIKIWSTSQVLTTYVNFGLLHMIDTIWTRPQIDSSYCIWKYELQTFESSTTCAMSTHFQVSWNKNKIFKVVRLWELGGLRRANCSVIFKVILKVAKLQRLSWFLKLNVKYTVVSAHHENKIKYSFCTTY